MAILRISKEDRLRGKRVRPGWYPFLIKAYQEKPAAKDKSTNFCFSLLIDGSGSEFDGVPIDHSFNEKAPSFLEPFLIALGETVTDDSDWSLVGYVGRRFEGLVYNDEFKGRMTNKISDFRPAASA